MALAIRQTLSRVWKSGTQYNVVQFPARHWTHCSHLAPMASIRALHISAGSDAQTVTASVNDMTVSGQWRLTQGEAGIERSYQFRTFKAAWAFMNDVAAECKNHKHHPEWSNVYNHVFVRWTTHSPPGLSDKDITMAKICDEFAARHETHVGATSVDDTVLRAAADTVSAAAGDCCVPQSSRHAKREQIEQEERSTGAQGSVAGMGGQPS